jgi:PAS domain S-box-containing protein
MPTRRFADRVIAEALPQPVWSATPDGDVDYVNPFWTDYTGLPFAEALGDGWVAAVQPDDVGPALERWRCAREAGEPFEVEFRLRRAADGAWRRHLARIAPMRDAENRVTAWVGSAIDVDDRRRAEAERDASLRQATAAEERFRALFEQSPLSVQVLAPSGETVAVNRAWEALWGVSPADIPDYNVLTDPQLEAAGVTPFLRRALAGEAVEIPPVPFVPDRGAYAGQARWVRAVAAPVRDANGTVAQVVLLHEDVTEATEARQRLERAIATERLVAEASRAFAEAGADLPALLDELARRASAAVGDGCAIWLLDDDGRRLRPAATHHPDPEVLAAVRRFFAGVDHEPEEGLVGRVARGGEPVFLPVLEPAALRDRANPVYRDHLDRYPAFGLLAVPMRARGRVVGVVATSRDGPGRPYDEHDLALLAELADRAALAVDNARLYDEAQTAEARYRGLFDGVADAILVADADRRYRDANNAATDLLGYERDELVRMRVDDVVASGPEWTEAEFARYLAEGRWHGELELRRKDGSTVPVEALASIVELPTGPVYLSAVRDVSERKRLERLHQDFLAMVGHDLRTPLAALKGTAQLMRRRGVFSDRATETILTQTARMERLLADLGALTEVEAGVLELRREPFDLRELIDEDAVQARRLSERHEVVVSAPDAPVVGSWDRDRLAQVLQNLLSNAVKYSPDGGTIDVRLAVDGGEARVAVSDRGVGIRSEELPHVFDRFYRARARTRAPGLGLGLYITRMLVEAHGGRVGVVSEPGRGSTFTVVLPLAVSPAG